MVVATSSCAEFGCDASCLQQLESLLECLLFLALIVPVCVHELEVRLGCQRKHGNFVENCVDPSALDLNINVANNRVISIILADRSEGSDNLFSGAKAELLEEVEVVVREVVAVLLEEKVFIGRKRNVSKLCPSRLVWDLEVRSPKTAFLTSNLLFEPLEGGSRQLLVWSSVGVGVCHRYIFEELEDGTLHRQLVQISVEEGDDALWEG